MIPAFQSAQSGLKAFATTIQANADNIANASSDNFKKTRVTMASGVPQGVKTTVEKVDTPGVVINRETSEGTEKVELSNVDLGEELPKMMVNSHFYKANLKTIQVSDDMIGSLLKIKS